MAEISLGDIQIWQWVLLFLSAVLIGITKTGVPGIGILVVPLMAIAFPAKTSTGLLLPILIFADIFAVIYYRRDALWGHIFKLLPPAIAGLFAGSIVIRNIDNAQLKPMIGLIVLLMLALNYWRNKKNGGSIKIPSHWSFAVAMGFFAGLTTQLANAAGPVMIIYLLAMRLDKYNFMGTAAWFFMIINWLKVPLFIWDGRITAETVKIDAITFGFIVVGVLIGIFIIKRIPQHLFNSVVQILAVLAAFKLVLSVFGI